MHAMIDALIAALPPERQPALVEEQQLLNLTVATHFSLPADLALVRVADSQGLGSGSRQTQQHGPGA
jgi:hypothetical protein